MKRWFVGFMILSLCVGLTGCFKTEAEESEKEEAYKTVKVEAVKLRKTDATLIYSGVVKSESEKNVSFKTAGRIKEILVQEGEVVEVGQGLAVIDTTDLELQGDSASSQLFASEKEIAMAKESYDYYQKEYVKNQTLYEGGVVSKASMDVMELNLEKARLTYEISKEGYNRVFSEKKRIDAMLVDGRIHADRRGIIDQINVEVFEYVSPAQPAFIIRTMDQMVVTYVSGEDKKKIIEGQSVNLEIDGEKLKGTIKYVDDGADVQTHSYRVEIAIDDSSVLNGAIASVEFIIGEQQGIWIPMQSVQTTTIDFVYLIRDNRASKQVVKILEVQGDEIRVEGLEPEEQLVVSGMKSLVEGMLVKAEE